MRFQVQLIVEPDGSAGQRKGTQAKGLKQQDQQNKIRQIFIE